MTDQPPGSTTPPPPPADPARAPSFEERMEDFGRRADAAGERFGREAEAAGQRIANDPGVKAAADTAGRAWGLILVAVGLWFFADVTLGIEMPSIAWRDLWPVALIVIGLAIVLRGLASRRA